MKMKKNVKLWWGKLLLNVVVCCALDETKCATGSALEDHRDGSKPHFFRVFVHIAITLVWMDCRLMQHYFLAYTFNSHQFIRQFYYNNTTNDETKLPFSAFDRNNHPLIDTNKQVLSPCSSNTFIGFTRPRTACQLVQQNAFLLQQNLRMPAHTPRLHVLSLTITPKSPRHPPYSPQYLSFYPSYTTPRPQ